LAEKFYLTFGFLTSSQVGLKKFVWSFGSFWPFYAEKISSEGKYYYSIFFGNTFAKCLQQMLY